MRVVLFTDANNATTTGLVRETVRRCSERDDLELCGIVTSRPDAFRSDPARDAWRRLRRIGVAAANPGSGAPALGRTRFDLFRLARSLGLPVLAPPGGNPNAPEFVDRLRTTTRPDVALSYYCGTIWKPALLDVFATAVNYHDGALPRYKGVGATSFSIYHGEATSGFTFHHMTEGIDAGAILVQDTVAVDEGSTFADVDRRKWRAAVAAVPRMLDLVAARDAGRPQTGPDSYFSRRDYLAATHVHEPELLTTAELRLRIRAFGAVHVEIAGATWPVTRIRTGRPGRLTFATADDPHCTADRVRGIPGRLARRAAPA
jgi:hypothetical protein